MRIIDGNQLYEQLFGHVPLGTIDAEWFSYSCIRASRARRPLPSGPSIWSGPPSSRLWLAADRLAAIAIKLTDGGSVFYRQSRVGEGGREYEILKLRTMTEDAEAPAPSGASRTIPA